MNHQGELLFLLAGFWTGAGLLLSFDEVFVVVFGVDLTGVVEPATGLSLVFSAARFVVFRVVFDFVCDVGFFVV